jgi:hypothetical protein
MSISNNAATCWVVLQRYVWIQHCIFHMHCTTWPAVEDCVLQFVLHDTPLGQWAVDSVPRTPGMLKSILERQDGESVAWMV